MPNTWISKDSMSLSDMENNVKIIYPTLYGLFWKKPAIVGICSWMEYVSSINPEYSSGDKKGLLLWDKSDMGSGGHLGGDDQLKFFNSTAADYWDPSATGNPNAILMLTLDEFRNSETMPSMVSALVFGNCYMHYNVDDYFLRQELIISSEYWEVYIDTLPQPPEPEQPEPEPPEPGKIVKKKKIWKYLKPRWR